MKPLPPPTSFAEGMRLAFGFLVAAAGMFCGAASIGMIALLMWGGWSASEEHTIVLIFGWSLGGYIACMAMVIGFLAVGGPVGRFKAGIGKEGGTLEVSDAQSPAPMVTTTTTVTPPPAPPATAPPATAPPAPGPSPRPLS